MKRAGAAQRTLLAVASPSRQMRTATMTPSGASIATRCFEQRCLHRRTAAPRIVPLTHVVRTRVQTAPPMHRPAACSTNAWHQPVPVFALRTVTAGLYGERHHRGSHRARTHHRRSCACASSQQRQPPVVHLVASAATSSHLDA